MSWQETEQYAANELQIGHCGQCSGAAIEDETHWRARPSREIDAPAKIVATRWRGPNPGPQQVKSATPAGYHVLGIELRSTNLRLSVPGRVVQDGVTAAGTIFMTAPSVEAHCLFRAASDTLHLHIPHAVIAEYTEDVFRNPNESAYPETLLARDALVERLGRTLLKAQELGAHYGEIYVESIATAIVGRLLASHAGDDARHHRPTGLPSWRLKRALEFIEAHLADSISLADIAATTGLTRMHFAAQFRAATQMRPHEYLLRRRIERAQDLILAGNVPLAQVALSVGFQTQSHFTRVFKRFIGQPPNAWHRSHEDLTSAATLRSSARSGLSAVC